MDETKGEGRMRKKGVRRHKHGDTPEAVMKQLCVLPPQPPAGGGINVDFGADNAPSNLDPVQFCLAVINGDVETLRRCGVVEVPGLDHKLIAARVSAPYINQQKPRETIVKTAFSWADSITAAEQRAIALRLKVENGQRDSTGSIN